MKQRNSMLIRWLRDYFPMGALLGAGIIITGNWAAAVLMDGLELGLSGKVWVWSWPRFCYVLLFFGLVLWGAQWTKRRITQLLRPYTRHFYDKLVIPHRHLLLFLSVVREDLEATKGLPVKFPLSRDLDCDIAILEEFKKEGAWTPWEMPLRGIREHLPKLKTVIVVCSWESLLQIDIFLELCRHYPQLDDISFCLLVRSADGALLLPAGEPFISQVFPAWDFESFDELSTALLTLVEYLPTFGMKEQDLMVDITGGQKPTSAVAAAMTFNRRIKAQYVQTNAPWKVISYDVDYGFWEKGSLLS